jgi:hypothetical protein
MTGLVRSVWQQQLLDLEHQATHKSELLSNYDQPKAAIDHQAIFANHRSGNVDQLLA